MLSTHCVRINRITYNMILNTIDSQKAGILFALWAHKRKPIPRPYGRAMELHLWICWRVRDREMSREHHYNDVIMTTIASQITSLTLVYPIAYSDADQRKHQSSASLAFVRGIHRGPVNSPHKWPVTRKMFPFDDVIMQYLTRLCFPPPSVALSDDLQDPGSVVPPVPTEATRAPCAHSSRSRHSAFLRNRSTFDVLNCFNKT